MNARPGPAFKIRGAFETGAPVPGTLTAATARRLKYLRDQWFENAECQAFMDPKTEEVYLIPTGKTYDPDAAPVVKHAKPRASRASEPKGTLPQVSHDSGASKPSVCVRKHRTLEPL